ncbi:F-box domain-containing protein [Mycena sanguinolenta]|uniref:F-box domain-containing protein n=1 Tax=Mycena sanguinolenta TaxID=230812 RepID=A0A8H7D0M2_9AGAR|nr:F-box domain-containing protein [Mycena sanguinolenta]
MVLTLPAMFVSVVSGPTPASIRAAVREQIERTKHSSKMEIARFIKDSELEIASLDSKIRALTKLRDSQRACVLALRYIIAPIRTLPLELMAEIFELTIEDETHIRDAHRISQVCSHWREVAHGTPRLWSRPLRIELCRKGGFSRFWIRPLEEKEIAAGLKAWLARSAPLSISISFGLVTKNMYPAVLEEVLAVASRSRSLIFPTASDFKTPVPLLRQLIHAKLDRLEELNLGIIDKADHTPIAFAVPRLRTFSIADLGEPQIIVPWSQLTELTFSCGSPDVILEVLSQCGNLVSASITILKRTRLPGPGVGRDTSIQLSHLRSLDLDFMADFASLFDYLSAPVLQDLRLELGEMHWTQAHLTAFQLRAPNITQLEILSGCWSFTSDNLVTTVRNSPLLTHLELTCCDDCFDDAFIRALHYEPGPTPLVPRLHHLTVRDEEMNFTEEILAGMIASRWWTDTELISFVVPPAVARWTHVNLDVEYDFGSQFEDILKHVPSDVLRH